MNFAQIRSAVPEIFHTQKRFTDRAKNRTLRSSLRAINTKRRRRRSAYAVVSCAVIACNFAAILTGVAKIIAQYYFRRGFMCNCMQRTAIPACNS